MKRQQSGADECVVERSWSWSDSVCYIALNLADGTRREKNDSKRREPSCLAVDQKPDK